MDEFFNHTPYRVKARRLIRTDHFSAEGSIMSFKSNKPDGTNPDGDNPAFRSRNPQADFHGAKRSMDTNASPTAPRARRGRRSDGTPRSRTATASRGRCRSTARLATARRRSGLLQSQRVSKNFAGCFGWF